MVSKVGAFVLSTSMVLTASFSGYVPYLAGVSNEKSAEASSTDYELMDDLQGAAILQCWNWSYETIEDNMELIAESGYSAVQTSPITQSKDYTYDGMTYNAVGWPKLYGQGNWWKLYQPVAECVTDNGRSWLGTKEELESLCETADQYGVKVIVDVVANHMANISGWQNSLDDVCEEIGTYWNEDMLVNEDYWHINDYQTWMSDSRLHFTQGTMGMPDLNTANDTVQQYIYEYLDELIDCGVDGFRFDAAKHIETPTDDSDFASDFWPTVLDEAESHYKEVNGSSEDLYVYGEVLNTVGDNYDIAGYTTYMSVTDNAAGNSLLEGVRNSNAGSLSQHYDSDVSVLWAESHDTYMNESSVYASDTSIVRTWAMVANKYQASALFFPRPYTSEQILNDDTDGSIKGNDEIAEIPATVMGEVATYVWCSDEVAAINHFNNRFASYSDNSGVTGSIMYSQRGTGIVLSDLNGAERISISSMGLSDGTYTDEVSGNTFTVSDGVLSGTIASEMGIAVIYQNVMSNPSAAKQPYIGSSVGSETIVNTFTDSVSAQLTQANCTSATYTLSTGESGSISSDSTTIEFGEDLSVGDTVTLTIIGKNSAATKTRTYTFEKADLAVEGVSLSKSKVSIMPGNTYSLTATITPSNASDKSVTWSSSDTSVATVDDEGVVTAVTYGTATITVTTTDGGYTDTCTVTVTDDVASDVTIYFNNTDDWTLVYCYAWNDDTLVNNATWPGEAMTETDNDGVWSITLDGESEFTNVIFNNTSSQTPDLDIGDDGQIYDYSEGTWSDYSSEKIAVTGVSLSDSSISLDAGDTYTLTATITPSDATTKTVTWTSSNTTVATVSSGVVTGKSDGTATITATTKDGGYTATCTVTVTGTVDEGTTLYLDNVASWSSPYAYTWNESSQTADASWPGNAMTVVDSDEGIYSITLDADSTSDMIIFSNCGSSQTADLSMPTDGNNMYNNSTGTWSTYDAAISVTGVSLSSSSLTLSVGDTSTLTATVSPSDADDTSVSWSSSNTSVAKVSSSGVVTAVAAGTATITVITTDGSYTAACTVTVNEEEEEALVNNSFISQEAVVGQKVVFKGAATGGSGEYQYAYYYRKTTDTSWTTAGTEWGTAIYATAKPGSNTVYEVCIKVRDANNTSNIVKKYLSFAANTTETSLKCYGSVYKTIYKYGITNYITASSEGNADGSTVQYKYEYRKASSWTYETIKDYSEDTQVSWDAPQTGSFTLRITAYDGTDYAIRTINIKVKPAS